MFGSRPNKRPANEINTAVPILTSFSSKPWTSNPTTTWKNPSLSAEYDYHTILIPGNLRRTTAWIRDILEPKVACEGPDALLSDDALTVHTVLLALQNHDVSLHVLRFSRIHLAVSTICRRATRWPGKLIDEADRVISHFEVLFGPLQRLKVPIFGTDGRLFGICDRTDITRDVSNSLSTKTVVSSASTLKQRLHSAHTSQKFWHFLEREAVMISERIESEYDGTASPDAIELRLNYCGHLVESLCLRSINLTR
jgi:hypothetical protein